MRANDNNIVRGRSMRAWLRHIVQVNKDVAGDQQKKRARAHARERSRAKARTRTKRKTEEQCVHVRGRIRPTLAGAHCDKEKVRAKADEAGKEQIASKKARAGEYSARGRGRSYGWTARTRRQTEEQCVGEYAVRGRSLRATRDEAYGREQAKN